VINFILTILIIFFDILGNHSFVELVPTITAQYYSLRYIMHPANKGRLDKQPVVNANFN